MGGDVILEAELLLLDRTIGLIPVDSLFPGSESPYIKQNEEKIKEITKPIKENFETSFRDFFDSLVSDKFDPKDEVNVETYIQSLDQRSLISARTELLKWDLNDVLPRIKKPIKCMIAGLTLNHQFREEYDNFFDAVYLEGLKHMLHKEDPESFNLILEQRINEIVK
jgi:hypothetical protein